MHLYPSIEHGGMQIELNNVQKMHIVKPRTEREAMEDEMFWLTGSPMKTTKQRARIKELAEQLKEMSIE
jgi:hypothetical protein